MDKLDNAKINMYGSLVVLGLLFVAGCLAFFAMTRDESNHWINLSVLVSMVLSFVVGWISLIPGRRMVCKDCGERVLKPDVYGFVGLRFGPLYRMLRGQSGCEICK